MPMPRSTVFRNEVFVRIDDSLLRWLDQRREEVPRSTYVRRVLEEAARRDLQQRRDDEPAME